MLLPTVLSILVLQNCSICLSQRNLLVESRSKSIESKSNPSPEQPYRLKYFSLVTLCIIPCFTSLTEPTQIYRYLRTRNMISPIFLHRTLSFMRKRTSRSRSDKYRQEFKVDSLLKRKESEIRETDTIKLDRFMNLTFLGYYDRKCK